MCQYDKDADLMENENVPCNDSKYLLAYQVLPLKRTSKKFSQAWERKKAVSLNLLFKTTTLTCARHDIRLNGPANNFPNQMTTYPINKSVTFLMVFTLTDHRNNVKVFTTEAEQANGFIARRRKISLDKINHG